VTAVVRVHQLERADPRPEHLQSGLQVCRRLRHLDDLDDRPAGQFELLARLKSRGMQQMRRLPVEQARGPEQR